MSRLSAVRGATQSAKARRFAAPGVVDTCFALLFCGTPTTRAGYHERYRPARNTAADWSELGVSELLLPTGTVTLLLADVEGSTRLAGHPTRRDGRRRGSGSDRILS